MGKNKNKKVCEISAETSFISEIRNHSPTHTHTHSNPPRTQRQQIFERNQLDLLIIPIFIGNQRDLLNIANDMLDSSIA